MATGTGSGDGGAHDGGSWDDDWRTDADADGGDAVDIFVFAADDESLTPVAPAARPRTRPLPDDHDDSDWNDTSWLHDLDDLTSERAAPDAARASSEDDAEGPTSADDVSSEQLDEAVQVLAVASGARGADDAADADVAALLRELSLLSLDD